MLPSPCRRLIRRRVSWGTDTSVATDHVLAQLDTTAHQVGGINSPNVERHFTCWVVPPGDSAGLPRQ
jgi:hypothetical protein